MDFKHFDWSFKNFLKGMGFIIAGIIVLTIVISLISLSFKTVFQFGSDDYAYNESFSLGGYGGMVAQEMAMTDSPAVKSLSSRIVLPPEPGDGYSTGDTAEDFEVRDHFASLKTRKLEEMCEEITALKVFEWAIFENANQSDRHCSFSFKVLRDHEQEVIDLVQDLDPDTFTTNVHTIKRIVDDYDSELDILQKKLDSIEETLSEAQSAYDELQRLATRQVDVESLAMIIDNKLQLIDRLTQQRIEIRSEIDRFNKVKAEQLDRLQFAFFNVNISEDLFIDFDRIKENWKREIQQFFTNVNEMIQNVTITLAEYVLRFLMISVYFFVSLFLLKGVWMITKKVWKGKKGRR